MNKFLNWWDFTANLNVYNSKINTENVDVNQVNDALWSAFGKINNSLIQKIPDANNSSFHLKAPVSVFKKNDFVINHISCSYFVSDLRDKNKNFDIIPILDSILLSKGIVVSWHFAGDGYSLESLKSIWNNHFENRIFYYGKISNSNIESFVINSNVMLLPSFFEGFPISIVEAMKMGVIPIINDWNGATDELIIHNETGFKVSDNSIEEYVAIFSKLASDITILNEMSVKASELANQLFDPVKNTLHFNQKIKIASKSTKKKIPLKIYGSRLDHPLIPNVLVKAIRSIKNIF
jgi:glycosyltransferase involved in cell wall biosynthesis